MTKARVALVAVLAAALVFACQMAINRLSKISWPEFPQSPPGKAQSVTVLEPRFGWRTGDVVQMTIYLRESDGTVYDTGSLAVKGDARLRNFRVDSQSEGDGSDVRLHRIEVEVQAFSWKQVWEVVPTIYCRRNGKRELVELPAVSISSSRTYDGDKTSKHPEDAPLDYLASYDWLGTLAVAALAAGLFGCCEFALVGRFRRVPVVPDCGAPWLDRVKLMTDAVDAMTAGQDQSEHCRTIDRLMREAYGVEAVGLLRLHGYSGEGRDLTSLTLVLSFCQDVVYAGSRLTSDELEKLRELVVEAAQIAARQSPETAGDLLGPPVVPDVKALKNRRLKLRLLFGLVVLGLALAAALAGWAMWMDAQVPEAF